jgi:hypothetical protein
MHVRLPNHTTRGIPAWRFDEVICEAKETRADLSAAEKVEVLRNSQLFRKRSRTG